MGVAAACVHENAHKKRKTDFGHLSSCDGPLSSLLFYKPAIESLGVALWHRQERKLAKEQAAAGTGRRG